MLKRSFDIVVSAVALALLSPVILIIALVIRVTSPGPVLYMARRVGLHGELFPLYKFRSMVVNAAALGPGVTAAGDKRVTPIGRFLRRTKLDELPQFYNVLRGDMSLVGPRPEDPRYVAYYTTEQKRVLDVRPGITSPATVHFRSEESLLSGNDTEAVYISDILPSKLAIDLDYANHASLWLDITILWRTFVSIFRGL